MKKLIALSVIGLLSFKPQPATFWRLHQLVGGTWVMQTARGTLCERWYKTNDTRLDNRSFRTQGKDTIQMERVELSIEGNEINYISTVPNQNEGKPVPFILIEATNNEFIFSNADHDFPQRITYHFINSDSLHAWIDGKVNGKEVKRDYYYRRVK